MNLVITTAVMFVLRGYLLLYLLPKSLLFAFRVRKFFLGFLNEFGDHDFFDAIDDIFLVHGGHGVVAIFFIAFKVGELLVIVGVQALTTIIQRAHNIGLPFVHHL